jgi:hypothetical protein
MAAIAACLTFSTAHAWDQDQEQKASAKAAADARAAASAASEAAAKVLDSGNGIGIGRGGAGGSGGQGGAGGIGKGGSATGGSIGAVTTTTGPSSASISGTGSTFNTNERSSVFVPAEASRSPDFMMIGGIRMDKLTEGCGPWPNVEKFKDKSYIAKVFGLWTSTVTYKTMHGIFLGYLAGDEAFIKTTINVPTVVDGKVVMVSMTKYTGAELYTTTETLTQGSAGSIAGNALSEKASAASGSGAISTNMTINRVAVAAIPCNFKPVEAPKAPEAKTEPPAGQPDSRDQKIKDQQEIILRMQCKLDLVADRSTCPADAKPRGNK